LNVERLHKILAARGVASRRASEALIASGRVSVDGHIVREMGLKVSPDADIRVDGRQVSDPAKAYFILNKPRGYVTTLHDDRGRKSVGEILKRLRSRVYPVGRLDAETEGLLLVTNDGEMTNVLTHPRYHVEKTYFVTVRGHMDEVAIRRLRGGVFLPEGRFAARVKLIRATRETTRLEMTITQGINRQIRRMCIAVGHEVKRLERIRFGPLRLKGLPRGGFRPLTRDEISALKKYCARTTASGGTALRENTEEE
jgi:23S rRNA pseudouridine2605 synthase